MGQPQFTRITYNPFREFKSLDLSHNQTIASGATRVTNIYAPVGFVGRVVSMQLAFPKTPTAASGTRSIRIKSGGVDLVDAQSVYSNDFLHYEMSDWLATNKWPSDQTAQLMAQNRMVYDEDTPLVISFTNFTNVASLVYKTIILVVEEEKIR